MSEIIFQDPVLKSQLVANEVIRVTNNLSSYTNVDDPNAGIQPKGIKVTTLNHVLYALQIISKLETGQYLFEDESFKFSNYGPYLDSIWNDYQYEIPSHITKPCPRLGATRDDNGDIHIFNPLNGKSLNLSEIVLIETYVPKLMRFSYNYLLRQFVQTEPQWILGETLKKLGKHYYDLNTSVTYWKQHQFWNQIK